MPTYTVKAGVNLAALDHTGSRNVARLSDGTLFVAYMQSDGTRLQIYISYSTDGGVTWTEEQVSFAVGANNQLYPTLAVNSLGQVHVAWSGAGWGINVGISNIQYRMRNAAGVWQAQEGVTDLTRSQDHPAIGIDSIDTVHLVWESNGDIAPNNFSNIAYNQRVVAWGVAEAVTIDIDNNYTPSIAIDSANDVHVVWRTGAFPTCLIRYRLRTIAWQPIEIIDTDSAIIRPCIAIDNDDNPHVVWEYNAAPVAEIRYAKRNGAWGAWESVYVSAVNSSTQANIAITLDGTIQVSWSGDGWGLFPATNSILYSRRVPPWSIPEVIVDVNASDEPTIFLWAKHPTIGGIKPNIPVTGYILVFVEETGGISTVKILLSGNLSWIVAPTVSTLAATGVT